MTLLCRVYGTPMLLAQTFRKKKKSFNFLIQFFNLYLETKPILIFQSIILHMDLLIIVAF